MVVYKKIIDYSLSGVYCFFFSLANSMCMVVYVVVVLYAADWFRLHFYVSFTFLFPSTTHCQFMYIVSGIAYLCTMWYEWHIVWHFRMRISESRRRHSRPPFTTTHNYVCLLYYPVTEKGCVQVVIKWNGLVFYTYTNNISVPKALSLQLEED